MPKIKSSGHVKFLAFEGGGGKGVVYLGAVRALEQLKVLPIKTCKTKGYSQIKGISGSSAGGIVALFLSLGATSGEIEEFLGEKAYFDSFFDDPANGRYRIINEKGFLKDGGDYVNDEDDEKRRSEVLKKVVNMRKDSVKIKPDSSNPMGPMIESMLDTVLGTFKFLFKLWIQGKLPSRRLESQLGEHLYGYIYNLTFDRGVFPGIPVSHYFLEKIHFFLRKNYTVDGSELNAHWDISFKELYDITKIDLVITGVNVTKQRPLNFSHTLTPHFSVAGAASISMNIPGLFKPIRVDYPGKGKLYKGFWADGGMLNNLPLHAFDDNWTMPNATFMYDALPLHPGVLGLRLEVPKETKTLYAKDIKSPTLFNYLGEIWGSLSFPAEEGQIRTQSERDQTIELNSGDLSAINFTPDKHKSKRLQAEAEKKVLKYFLNN